MSYRWRVDRTLVRGECVENILVGIGCYDPNAGGWWDVDGCGALEPEDVLAWMPLPEPYSEE